MHRQWCVSTLRPPQVAAGGESAGRKGPANVSQIVMRHKMLMRPLVK